MPSIMNVFNTICKHYKKRRKAFRYIAETGYSFEEWSNWEAFLCCKDAGFNVDPKPSYSKYVDISGQSSGDLGIKLNSKKYLIIEFGIAHKFTAKKWSLKLEEDRDKIRKLHKNKNVTTMQFLLLLSYDEIFTKKWLDSLSFGNHQTPYNEEINLTKEEKLICRAWQV